MAEIPTPQAIADMAAEAGITISEMLHRARLSPATYSRWKTGQRRHIRAETIQRMLDAIAGKEYVQPSNRE